MSITHNEINSTFLSFAVASRLVRLVATLLAHFSEVSRMWLHRYCDQLPRDHAEIAYLYRAHHFPPPQLPTPNSLPLSCNFHSLYHKMRTRTSAKMCVGGPAMHVQLARPVTYAPANPRRPMPELNLQVSTHNIIELRYDSFNFIALLYVSRRGRYLGVRRAQLPACRLHELRRDSGRGA